MSADRRRALARFMTRSQRRDVHSAVCRVFRHDFDGTVFEEISPITSRRIWVARLECVRCGTERVDTMIPGSCELISRNYHYPEDYRSDLDRAEARKLLFTGMKDAS